MCPTLESEGSMSCLPNRDALRRDAGDLKSQLSFKRAENGKCCLVYREDTTTKTHDGGLKTFKKDRKVVWVFPSENIVHCPVRLVDKYISLLPVVALNAPSLTSICGV